MSDISGVLLFQSIPREKKPHVFGSVLKSNNDNYYLDCILASNDPLREYRYRITFVKKREVLNDGK